MKETGGSSRNLRSQRGEDQSHLWQKGCFTALCRRASIAIRDTWFNISNRGLSCLRPYAKQPRGQADNDNNSEGALDGERASRGTKDNAIWRRTNLPTIHPTPCWSLSFSSAGLRSAARDRLLGCGIKRKELVRRIRIISKAVGLKL